MGRYRIVWDALPPRAIWRTDDYRTIWADIGVSRVNTWNNREKANPSDPAPTVEDMTTLREMLDGTIILGDGEHEIVVGQAELANLHQHLGAIIADREAQMRAIADAV